ncbi:hypothetical protein ABPG72_019631 [Tetrahymena utriculariae]
MNQNYLYLPSDKIDQYLLSMETELIKSEEECKFQNEMYTMKKIDNLDSLFELYHKIIRFDLFFQNQFSQKASTIISDKKLRSTNIQQFKEMFLKRMKEEIRNPEYKNEESIFQFLVQRSSDNEIIQKIGMSIFKETLNSNPDMLLIFKDIFGCKPCTDYEVYSYLDCQLAGSITIQENNDKKLVFKADLSHFRDKLYIKDCMQLVKSVLVFSFIFDMIMHVLFTLSVNYMIEIKSEGTKKDSYSKKFIQRPKNKIFNKVKMGKTNYSREPANQAKAVKTSASDLRVHFKNTYEVVKAIKGLNLENAKRYLKAVIDRKRCIPFTRFTGCIGRTAQAHEFGRTQGRWPVKSVKVILGLLDNLSANAQAKSLNTANLVIQHGQVNRAQKGRRRTYRAHGRINPYLNSGCHVEIFAQEVAAKVRKEAPKDTTKKVPKTKKGKLAIGN